MRGGYTGKILNIDLTNYNYSILQIKDYENWVLATAKIISKLKIKDAAPYLEKIYNKYIFHRQVAKQFLKSSNIFKNESDIYYYQW